MSTVIFRSSWILRPSLVAGQQPAARAAGGRRPGDAGRRRAVGLGATFSAMVLRHEASEGSGLSEDSDGATAHDTKEQA